MLLPMNAACRLITCVFQTALKKVHIQMPLNQLLQQCVHFTAVMFYLVCVSSSCQQHTNKLL